MAIELKINPLSGGKAGKMDLSDNNFGVEFNEPLVHQVVVAYQAGGRSGTRAQKIVLRYVAEAQSPGDRKVLAGQERELSEVRYLPVAAERFLHQPRTFPRR